MNANLNTNMFNTPPVDLNPMFDSQSRVMLNQPNLNNPMQPPKSKMQLIFFLLINSKLIIFSFF